MPRTPASNPFRFGALALDEAFADRETELAELVADARNGQDVVVLAPRRYGKSSLVWRASQKLASARVLVASVDLMMSPTKERLAERLAGTIFANIATPLERVRERALAPFRGLSVQPTVTIDPETGHLSFAFGFGQRPADIDSTLERLLELPAQLAAGRRRRVVMVFDEFQEIVEIDRSLPRLMRSVFQQQPEVAHIYLGSRRHVMEGIFSDENEPFWRSAKPIELGPIDKAPFGAFIADRFGAGGKRVPDEVKERLLDVTGGHPYATQELCYFLWEVTPARGSAGPDRLEAALDATLRAEHTHFSLVWADASAGQKLVLAALAREQPGRPLTAAYRREHGLPPATNVQRALRGLVDAELLDKDGGSYTIAEPFLAEWIAANAGG